MDKKYQLDEATVTKLSKLLPRHNMIKDMCKKIAFSHFYNSIPTTGEEAVKICCGELFSSDKEVKKHLSKWHSQQISVEAKDIEKRFFAFLTESVKKDTILAMNSEGFSRILANKFHCTCHRNFKVILFYHYIEIGCTTAEIIWQKTLGEKLKLKGKIRVATEGINGTAEGCKCAVKKYIDEMLQHFPDMVNDDFKLSDGDGMAFDSLKVTEYEELCSMGISPEKLRAMDGGRHLTSEEFHTELEEKKQDTVLLDCRNFYESKIGYFEDAVRPDLRKFSYFPTYVDKNPDLFKDKRVLMYCTGGIRCERASAYIKKIGICKEVLQLKGGIHKYLEKYPEGHYKGKLFVFDERYSIGGESQPPVARCKYCQALYDQYKLCPSPSCRQLVLSCKDCRMKGNTACCFECPESMRSPTTKKEECECTRSRDQVPLENTSASNCS